jgi:hypothetical protein
VGRRDGKKVETFFYHGVGFGCLSRWARRGYHRRVWRGWVRKIVPFFGRNTL